MELLLIFQLQSAARQLTHDNIGVNYASCGTQKTNVAQMQVLKKDVF